MRDRMRRVARAPSAAHAALLAHLAGSVVLASAWPAYAQTAAVPAATPVAAPADNCLTSPNAQTERGHWYYRMDRPSGRRCWYFRAEDGNKAGESENAKPRAVAAPPARPRAAAPAEAKPAAAPSAPAVFDNGGGSRSIAPPPAPSPATPNPAVLWPSVPAQPVERAPAPAADSATEQPGPPPAANSEAASPASAPDADIPIGQVNASPPPAPARPQAVERPVVAADGGAHLPALIGIALSLVLIFFGSRAIPKIARLRRRPRRSALIDLPETSWNESAAPFWTEERLAGLRVDVRNDTGLRNDDARRDDARSSRKVRDVEPDAIRRAAPRRAREHERPAEPGHALRAAMVRAGREPERPPPRRPEPASSDRSGAYPESARTGRPIETVRLFDDSVRELLMRLSAEMRPESRSDDRRVGSTGGLSHPVAPPLQPSADEPDDGAVFIRRKHKR
jgi:hypothetical protein